MNKPTDDEIAAFVDAFDWDGWICPIYAQRAFARAVLDKWGQPAHSVEPGYLDRLIDSLIMPPQAMAASDLRVLHDEVVAMLYMLRGSQPVEREPLTEDRIRSMCAQPWVFDTVKQWVRITEVAHGITQKGGQHGTE